MARRARTTNDSVPAAENEEAAAPATERRRATASRGATAKTARGRAKIARVDEESARKASRAAGKNLMIVESPAKARTLGKFLPKDFVVLASVGHVRDLPKNDLGVDVDNDFEPRYVAIRGKADVLKNLKVAASKARAVFLAPDPDREGEAIAWHLAEALQDKKTKTPAPVHRLTFNEITPRAVRAALEHPRDIDRNLVNAQQARRVLDRLVGYKVSPFLWQTVRYGLSAGRVQSVALRLICEREKEIRAFKAQEYWTIEAELVTAAGEHFRAAVVRVDKRRVGTAQDGERLEEAEARAVAEELRAGQRGTVAEVKEQERKRNPAPPFITSTLQQEAFKRFRFTSQRTMAIAQQLYEGVDISGEGPIGLITYMRTDSTRLADEAVAEIRAAIAERFGEDYVPEKPPRYAKREGAQDAHEAVRPTAVGTTPESLGKALTSEQAKLYGLVWRRAVASQMSAARDLVTTVDVEAGRLGLRASGTVPVFPGFRRVWGVDEDDDAKTSKLPRLTMGDDLTVADVVAERHETQPPPRFTEGTLVKALEELGIGRPSTYATIIGTIATRDYVTRDRGRLTPTDLGMTVSDLLTERFEDVFEVPFTAQMEEGLDRVESGAEEWHALVRRFYEPFSKDLEKAEAERDRLKRSLETETEVPCERCGRMLVRKFGRHGPFLACPGYPECKYTRPVEEADAPQEIGEPCPQCAAGLVQRSGRYGRFIACSKYPDCKYTRPIGLGIACPRPGCGGELVERRSRRGKVFFGCNKYPECDFALWDRPVAQACPQCGAAFVVRKTSKKKGDYLRCVTCNAEQAGEAA